jgi:hypothetical protein
MKIPQISTKYWVQMKASGYDSLEVEEDLEGRITIKFLDSRWRTKEETIAMLEEVISLIK